MLAVAAVIVALVLAMSRNRDSGAEPAATAPVPGGPTEVQGPEQLDLRSAERREADDLLAVGPVDAPVALVVFSDYQCPFCARWSAETLPLLMDHVDAGELRIEWRDVNVFGPASERAARASYAAAKQGVFWEYHDRLFEGGATRTENELGDEALIALAEELGLDVERFTADLASAETVAQITENAQLGIDLGAYSTPAFILGGQPIVGAQPSAVFLDAFAAALAAAR
ncbi:protein-disulfide isomerase [Salana multivorans]|uniref:Protein-disulfide isomerase n=1 Tax=Salana multivorans TaxID=120377 RepID=A0A3N2DA23_9MICO|nr:DsbA family protein [Salana multivorans]ROR96304.1 protein-disulfide isomerase [Salana multivorans]